MLYAFTEQLDVGIPAGSGALVPFYTVPRPRGKQPGVSGDGRLRIVTVNCTAVDAANSPMLTLVYLAPAGQVLAMFVEWETSQSNANAQQITWASEPSTGAFQGLFRDGGVGYMSRGGNDFRWLPAGSVCAISALGGFGGVTIDSVTALVEDFGQLGQGDEYDVGDHSVPQTGSTFLFPDANE